VVLLFAALGLGALATYVTTNASAAHVAPELRKPTSPKDAPAVDVNVQPTASQLASSGVTSLRLPVIEGQTVTLGSSQEIPTGVAPAVFAANEALKAAHVTEARALGVDIQHGVALIDFNDSIRDGVGSAQEASFIEAMQRTLGQIPGVDKFQITVEGKPIESLGHFEISDPVDVIRPDQKSADSKNAGG